MQTHNGSDNSDWWWAAGVAVTLTAGICILVYNRSVNHQPQNIVAIPKGMAPTITGTEFLSSVERMSVEDRERAIVAAVMAGQVPDNFRSFVPISVAWNGHTGRFWISPSALVVGTDADQFHAPVTVGAAQKIADHYGLMLPTRKMILAKYRDPGTIRIPFHAYLPSQGHRDLSTWRDSSAVIESRRGGRLGPTEGDHKVYILTAARRGREDRISIYGAFNSAGAPIQKGDGLPHGLGQLDYSQQPEFVLPMGEVDGAPKPLSEALADPALASLFSDDGDPGSNHVIPVDLQRYPAAR